MKTNKLFFIAWLLFTAGTCFAQTVEVDWGGPQDLEKKTWFHRIAGYDNDGYFLVRSEGILGVNDNKIWLEYYSSVSNTLESKNEIILPPVSGNPAHYEELFYINGKLILFTSGAVGSKKALFIQYLTPEGALKNKPKEVGSVPVDNLPEDGFKFTLLKDNRIMISYHNTFVQYNGEPFYYKIYNSDLIEDFAATLELPLKERSFKLKQSIAGPNNDIYLMVNAVKVVEKNKKGPEKYENIVIVYNSKKKEYHPFVIEVLKYDVSDAIFGVNAQDEIVVGGYIANKNLKIEKEFIGSFFLKINPRTLKMDPFDVKKNIKLFSKELQAEFAQKRNGETPNLYYNYFLKDIFFFENGGFAFIGEQFYTDSKTMMDPASKQETVIHYFYYNDILVCGVGKTGVMEWQQRIPKNQFSSDDNGYYHSYISFVDANKLKIIFNDNSSNLNNKTAEKTKEIKNNPDVAPKGQAVVATIYSDGSYEKYPFFMNDYSKLVVVPKLVAPIAKRFFVLGQEGKTYRLGTFVFE